MDELKLHLHRLELNDEQLLALQQFLGSLAKAADMNRFIPVKAYGVPLEHMRTLVRRLVDNSDVKSKVRERQYIRKEDDE